MKTRVFHLVIHDDGHPAVVNRVTGETHRGLYILTDTIELILSSSHDGPGSTEQADMKDYPYLVVSPMGNLHATSPEDAEAIKIWPDSVIIRKVDAEWIDRPLTPERANRLYAVNNLESLEFAASVTRNKKHE